MTTNMKKPLISIIMSTYNDSAYIKEAIESVLHQTLSDWEFIIINDASRDNTLEIIQSYSRKDRRFIIVANKENNGQTKNLIIGTEIAKGEFIARIDGDDVWTDKNKLHKQYNFLKSHSDYGLVGSWATLIDRTGRKIGEGRSPISDSSIRNYMLIENCFFHSSVMFRKSLIAKIGGYSSVVRSSQDYEFWLRIGLSYKLHNMSDFMINYRMNPNGMTSTNYDLQLSETFTMVKQYRNYYPHYKKAIFLWRLRKYVPKAIKTSVSNHLKNRFIARKAKQLFINLNVNKSG